jgi:hypothetical protein
MTRLLESQSKDSSEGGNVARKVIFMLAVVILIAMIALVGCGKEEKQPGVLKLGVMMDLSGPASFGSLQFLNGIRDHIQNAEEENLLGGVTVDWALYDHGSDYSKVPEGYALLKSEGVKLICCASTEAWVLNDQIPTDQIPFLAGTIVDPSQTQNNWDFFNTGLSAWDSYLLAEWIMTDWDYSNGIPDIGFLGTQGSQRSIIRLEGLQDMCDAYPDKLHFADSELPPSGTATFATELQRLRDCDYIMITIIGAGSSAFIREARGSGYDGRLMIDYTAGLSFWGTLKAGVPAEYLDGLTSVLYYPWWDDDIPFVYEVKDAIAKYRPSEYDTLLTGTGYLSGWAQGEILADSIRRAAEKVGAENVDSAALRDALEETNIAVAGWPEAWHVTDEWNCFFRDGRLYQYSSVRARWETISGWLDPTTALP